MHLAVCEDSRVFLFETINAAIRCTTDIFRWGGEERRHKPPLNPIRVVLL